jgi:hypothetical protein
MVRPAIKSGTTLAAAERLRRRRAISTPGGTHLRKPGYLAASIAGAAVTAAVFLAAERFKPAGRAAPPSVAAGQQPPSASALPNSYYDLLATSPDELGKADIALMNLLCAKGLPGAENLDIPAVLTKLDEWAAKVKSETQRHLYRVTDPKYAEHYAHSEARLRAEFIVQCLQEDCGVHYNEARINQPDFRDSRDLFLHGMTGSNGGTCSSMPVLYAAVGRRLGYPIKLVLAKQHIFCRWENGKDRLNFDGATNGGVNYDPDEHYRDWPHKITDAEMASGEFLKSLTPKEELATFLLQRACCLQAHHRIDEERACLAEALQLMPKSPTLQTALRSTVGMALPVRTAQRLPWEGDPYLPPQLRQSTPLDPQDPTPRIPMPGANPTFAIPNNPLGATKQEVRR